MSDISPIQGSHPTLARIAARRASEAQAQQGGRAGGGDKVELSVTARLAAKLREVPDVRQGLVNQARANIEAGVYDRGGVIDQTIEKMSADL